MDEKRYAAALAQHIPPPPLPPSLARLCPRAGSPPPPSFGQARSVHGPDLPCNTPPSCTAPHGVPRLSGRARVRVFRKGEEKKDVRERQKSARAADAPKPAHLLCSPPPQCWTSMPRPRPLSAKVICMSPRHRARRALATRRPPPFWLVPDKCRHWTDRPHRRRPRQRARRPPPPAPPPPPRPHQRWVRPPSGRPAHSS